MWYRNFYRRVGRKIQGFAAFIFILGALVSICVGGYYLFTGVKALVTSNVRDLIHMGLVKETFGYPIIIGLLLPIGGTLVAWIASWLIYGYGEFIDKNT